MSGTFSSYTYNFNALLGRSSFPSHTAKQVVVPKFQRGFSWEKAHISTFWEDIWDFYSAGGPEETYFLGPIVILSKGNQVLLLDGQQRLATSTILLSAIRDIARAKGGQKGSDLARDIQRDHIWVNEDDELYALTLGNLDKQYFENYIQLDPPSESVNASIRSHRLIRNASKYLHKKLEESFPHTDASELVSKLKRFSKSIVERIKLVVIEVTSEEEAYQIFETLNDRGLRLSVPDLLLNFLMQHARNNSQRDKIRQNWEQIIETIGMRKMSVFLRHFWISRQGDVKRQGLYREIREQIKSRGITSLKFTIDASKECQVYIGILNLEVVNRTAKPHIDALVNKLGVDKSFPLLLSGKISLNDSDFEKLARYTIALVTRHSVIANLNPNDLEDVLYESAVLIRNEKNSGKNSAQILKKVRSIFLRINPTREQITRGLEDLYLKKKQAEYILQGIANTIQSRSKTIEIGKSSIEHIFPQNAEEETWPEKKELEQYVWHIGNLAFLEPKKNRRVGNKSFDSKVDNYKASEITMTSIVAEKYSSWGKEQIINRAKSFAKIVDETWKF